MPLCNYKDTLDIFCRGAKLCVVKTKSKVQEIEVMAAQNIITRKLKYICSVTYI